MRAVGEPFDASTAFEQLTARSVDTFLAIGENGRAFAFGKGTGCAAKTHESGVTGENVTSKAIGVTLVAINVNPTVLSVFSAEICVVEDEIIWRQRGAAVGFEIFWMRLYFRVEPDRSAPVGHNLKIVGKVNPRDCFVRKEKCCLAAVQEIDIRGVRGWRNSCEAKRGFRAAWKDEARNLSGDERDEQKQDGNGRAHSSAESGSHSDKPSAVHDPISHASNTVAESTVDSVGFS